MPKFGGKQIAVKKKGLEGLGPGENGASKWNRQQSILPSSFSDTKTTMYSAKVHSNKDVLLAEYFRIKKPENAQ